MRKDRSNGKSHGGVAIYKLKFKFREDLNVPDDETNVFEVVFNKFSSFILFVTYRATPMGVNGYLILGLRLMLVSENKD